MEIWRKRQRGLRSTQDAETQTVCSSRAGAQEGVCRWCIRAKEAEDQRRVGMAEEGCWREDRPKPMPLDGWLKTSPPQPIEPIDPSVLTLLAQMPALLRLPGFVIGTRSFLELPRGALRFQATHSLKGLHSSPAWAFCPVSTH